MDSHKQELNDLLVKINFDNAAIKYCVYRTALKLSSLQEKLNLNKISIQSTRHIEVSSNKDNIKNENTSISSDMLSYDKLYKVVKTTLNYSAVDDESGKFAHRVSRLVFELYKDIRENKVALNAVILFFVVLGGDELQVKYKKLYELYAGPLHMLSRSRAALLLTHLDQITDVVGESRNFGKINESITSCFKGVLGNMISEHDFVQWMLCEPQPIVWLPTLHRLNSSKTAVHDIECSTCRTRPIVGMRFQCLKCLDFNSCQICFLTQQNSSRSHKLHHPLQEYCVPAGSKEKLNAMARTIRNIVTKRYKQKPLSSSYLPINKESVEINNSILTEDSVSNPNPEAIAHLADEENKHLEKIVHKLKKENKKITGTVHMLESIKTEDQPTLDEDHSLLQSQLDTVTLHNQSLQAELDNLKCVVFSENFISNNHQSLMRKNLVEDLNSCVEKEDEESINPSSSSSVTQLSLQYSDASDLFETRNKRNKKERVYSEDHESDEIYFFEEQLKNLVEDLGSSLRKKNLTENLVFKEMCRAADDVRHDINKLIDSALKV